jgi:hypothetical protein
MRRDFIITQNPALTLGFDIMILVFNLFGTSLRDALNVK